MSKFRQLRGKKGRLMMKRPNKSVRDSSPQPSLFPPTDTPRKNEAYKVRGPLEETSDSEAYFQTLDRLVEALADLLHHEYPMPYELRQQLSNPTLEALLFQELNRILRLQEK
jgi:hypothetical protein